MPQAHFTAGGVVRGADQVPLAGDEGLPEGECPQAPGAVSEFQDEALCGIGPKGEAATGDDVNLGDQARATEAGEGGKDGGLEGEIAEAVKGGAVWDDGVGPAIGLLCATGVLAANGRWQEFIAVAGPVGLAIAGDQADDVGLIAVDARLAAHHEADAFAGSDADLVAVARNLLFEHGSLPRG